MNESIKEFTVKVKRKGMKELRRGTAFIQKQGTKIIKSAENLAEQNETIKKGTEIIVEQGSKVTELFFEQGEKMTEILQNQTLKLSSEAVKLMDDLDRKKVWSGYDSLTSSHADEKIIPGCLVLEGGSFRGVYTSGVLDVLMENGINMQTTIGTSAGALNGYNYVAGEIGRSAKINLGYRHDRRYFGPRSAAKSRGVIGFNFILDEIESEIPFDHERFNRDDRRFIVTVTNCETGEVIYCEKGITDDMLKAVQASASMPFVSEMLTVENVPCLDGGCAVKIPYQWALDNGFEKILVIRTRPQKYRRMSEQKRFREVADMVYKNYPLLAEKLKVQGEQYNTACDELDTLHEQGRLYMLCPSGSIVTGSLEGDMEKLGALYLLGRRDAECMLPEIKKYLGLD